jgi:hypothetical protein
MSEPLLPPKLDLRKSGILKPVPVAAPPRQTQPPLPPQPAATQESLSSELPTEMMTADTAITSALPVTPAAPPPAPVVAPQPPIPVPAPRPPVAAQPSPTAAPQPPAAAPTPPTVAPQPSMASAPKPFQKPSEASALSSTVKVIPVSPRPTVGVAGAPVKPAVPAPTPAVPAIPSIPAAAPVAGATAQPRPPLSGAATGGTVKIRPQPAAPAGPSFAAPRPPAPPAAPSRDARAVPAAALPAAAPLTADSIAPTLKIQPRPVGSPPPTPTPPAASAPPMDSAAKLRMTSKISLSAAVPPAPHPAAATPPPAPAPAGGPLKTVEVRAAGPQATIRINRPPTAPAVPAGTDSKRKTSRISLDAALPGAGGTPAQKTLAPKTIRLKRPAQPGGLQVPAPAAAPAAETPPSGAAVSKTSRLDTAALDASASSGSPTRRRTIRVKRPLGQGEVGTDGLPVEGPPGSVAWQQPVPEVAQDRPNVVFHIVAIAAIVVLAVVTYLQSAQAFGPNVCLTPYSYAKDGPDLSWPGKIARGSP